MPPNRASMIRRRLRQADAALRRASEYLADVLVTVRPQHPDIGGSLLAYLMFLDTIRTYHKTLYRLHWGGTERGLHKPDDLLKIVEGAERLPDPSRGD